MANENIVEGGNNNTLLIVAVVVLLASIIGFFIVLGLNKSIQLAPVTGEEGNVTIEIIQNALIDTTFDLINFSNGFVRPLEVYVSLTSNSTGGPNSGWRDVGDNPISILDRGFVIENIGNIDLILGVSLEDDFDTWLPPGGPQGSINVTYFLSNCDSTPGPTVADCEYVVAQFNVVDDTAAACSTFNSGTTARLYKQIYTTNEQVCDVFNFENAQDELRLDINLTLPFSKLIYFFLM